MLLYLIYIYIMLPYIFANLIIKLYLDRYLIINILYIYIYIYTYFICNYFICVIYFSIK